MKQGVTCLMGAIALVCGQTGMAQSHHVAVTSRPVPLRSAGGDERHLGRLHFLGGVELRSSDPHFGGLSSLRWYRGRLLAMSDEGAAFYALRPREVHGRLVGVDAVKRVFLHGPDGVALSGKLETDIESMELNDPLGHGAPGSISFGFERHDRVWTYRLRHGMPVGRPIALDAAPGWFARQPDNLGVESMAGNRHVSLLISEGLKTPGGAASALLFTPGISGMRHPAKPVEIGIPAPGERRPCDLVLVSDHDFIMLRRSWTQQAGFEVEIDALHLHPVRGNADGAIIKRLAEFKAPVITDNFEGVAIRHEAGKVILYIVSDDNFEKSQRTLLLKFAID